MCLPRSVLFTLISIPAFCQFLTVFLFCIYQNVFIFLFWDMIITFIIMFTQKNKKSISFHLIAPFQHDSWSSLQSHAVFSFPMLCFSSFSFLGFIWFKSSFPQWWAIIQIAEMKRVERVVKGVVVWVRCLITAWIHFLILEHFLDLPGFSGDWGAHGQSSSQSERRISFPSL